MALTTLRFLLGWLGYALGVSISQAPKWLWTTAKLKSPSLRASASPEGVSSLKGLSLSCPHFQALDHRVRTLTGDLSLREDSIAKLQKEKRALEELHQVGSTGFPLAEQVKLGDWRPGLKSWLCCPSAGACWGSHQVSQNLGFLISEVGTVMSCCSPTRFVVSGVTIIYHPN